MATDSDSDLEPELLGNIAALQKEIDDDSNDEGVEEQERAIDKTIELNDALSSKLHNIKSMLQGMLGATQNQLKETQDEIRRLRTCGVGSSKFKPRKFGTPYFRDSSGRTPPPNADTVVQANLGMVNCFHLQPGNGWTRKDKDDLQREILHASRLEKIEQLEFRISELRNKNMSVASNNAFKQEYLNQISHIESSPISEVAKPIEEEYDWEDIAFKLKYRHTASEMRAMWKLHLHPSFRQGSLSRVEHCLLQNLITQHHFEDWDKIARELGGGRSGYQCFVLYRTAIADNHKGSKWTAEENEFLRQNVECYRIGNIIPWSTISTCFPNKSKIQIYNHYMRCVKPDLRKGRFILEEDEVLMAAVDQFGPDFKKVVQYLPGRDIAQVRQRYTMSLSRRSSAVWNVEEDRKLLHFINSMQLDSINFSEVAKHFEDKDRAAVRMRYVTLQRWMRTNPNTDIRSAPRRGPRSLRGRCLENLDLRTAVDNLVRKLEDETDDKPKITRVRNVALDEAILSVYIKHFKEVNKGESRANNTSKMADLAADEKSQEQIANDTYCMRILLLLLKANLNEVLFKSSSLGAKYIKLLEKDPDEEPVLRVKTYGKKPVTQIVLDEGRKVSIWSETKTYIPKYILPANYQLLCGCKSLLQEAHNSQGLRRHISLVRASPLKTHYEIFLERCEVLFTWPLFLSNVPPVDMLTGSIHDNTVEQIVPDINTELDLGVNMGAFKPNSCTFEPKYGQHVRNKECFKEVNDKIDLPINPEIEMKILQAEVLPGSSDPESCDETEDPLLLSYSAKKSQNKAQNKRNNSKDSFTPRRSPRKSNELNKNANMCGNSKSKRNSPEEKEKVATNETIENISACGNSRQIRNSSEEKEKVATNKINKNINVCGNSKRKRNTSEEKEKVTSPPRKSTRPGGGRRTK